MTNPYRALIAELIELSAPVDSVPQLAERLQKLNALADRARTLLAKPEVAWKPMPLPGDAEGLAEVFWAEPEAEEPSDEEIISQADKFLAYSDAHMGDPARWEGSDVDLVAFIRHALARWGRPAAAPVPEPGEVAELVLMLHHAGDALRLHGVSGTARACDRAATLLQQQAAPVPEPGETQP